MRDKYYIFRSDDWNEAYLVSGDSGEITFITENQDIKEVWKQIARYRNHPVEELKVDEISSAHACNNCRDYGYYVVDVGMLPDPIMLTEGDMWVNIYHQGMDEHNKIQNYVSKHDKWGIDYAIGYISSQSDYMLIKYMNAGGTISSSESDGAGHGHMDNLTLFYDVNCEGIVRQLEADAM